VRRVVKKIKIRITATINIGTNNPMTLNMNSLMKLTVELAAPLDSMRRRISMRKHQNPRVSVIAARFLLLYQAEIATRGIAKVENVSHTLRDASIAAADRRASS
jgi:hypothetical protein